MKVDTERGYVRRPKERAGYKIEGYYCECGCKKSYWRYVLIKKEKIKLKQHETF